VSRLPESVRRFLTCRTPGALRRLRDTGDDGFTLIELIIVVIILPLIIGAIAVALLVTFREQVGVSTRVSASVDAQITSAYFVRDVESALYLTTTETPTSAAWPTTAGKTTICGTGTTLIVSLAWPSGQQPIHTSATVVSYWKLTNNVLERELCKGGATPSTSITSRGYLSPFAHALLSCIASQPTCGTGAATTWVPAKWVSAVTLAVAESVGKYDYSLTASPRASSGGGAYSGGNTPAQVKKIPPLLALGAGTAVVTETAAGGKAKITVVTGTAVLDTGYFRMTNTTTFTAPKIVVGPKTPCNKTTFKLAKCTGTITPPKAKWTHSSTPTIFKDPFSTLADPTPTTLGLTIRTTCTPHTGKLSPGEYECGGTALTLNGGQTVTLTHGIYIFDTGLKVQGGSTLHGTTVLIYLPCRHAGVDQWVPSGTKAFTCKENLQVSNGAISVTPLGTPPYSNLWFWQNSGDTNPVKISGTGALSVRTGVLYAPAATVTLTGLGTNTTTVGAIIAATFSVSNSKVKVKGFNTL
jgi:prepilin-type N-terminal cleavage/methylation domain-containing protein